jgi:hypothetical protein
VKHWNHSMPWSISSAIIDCWGQTLVRLTVWAAVCPYLSFLRSQFYCMSA